MAPNSASRKIAHAAIVRINREKGVDHEWFNNQNLISDEESLKHVAKRYKHVIRKLNRYMASLKEPYVPPAPIPINVFGLMVKAHAA